MPILRQRLDLNTVKPIGLTDLTDLIRHWVRGSGIRDGLLTISSPHTTARITINEREPGLQGDMVRFLEGIAPRGAGYAHDRDTVDDRENAHAHLLALFLSASESIPVVNGEPALGAWQSIFFVELDGPRRGRKVDLQLMGEG